MVGGHNSVARHAITINSGNEGPLSFSHTLGDDQESLLLVCIVAYSDGSVTLTKWRKFLRCSV